MRILAFDTATSATAVAFAELDAPVSEDVQAVVQRRDDPPPGARPNHTTRLLELIEEVLAEAGVTWSELDLLAVGVGPGTFTGLRIGVATAQALARAQGLGLVGVSSLEALARPALAAEPDRSVLAVLDARRGEAFAAGWLAGARPGRDLPVVPPSVLTPEELQRTAAELGPKVLAVGDGAVKFAQRLERSGVLVAPDSSELHRITALAHCQLAAGSSFGEPGAVQPQYLRQPDAETARRA